MVYRWMTYGFIESEFYPSRMNFDKDLLGFWVKRRRGLSGYNLEEMPSDLRSVTEEQCSKRRPVLALVLRSSESRFLFPYFDF